MTEPLGDSAAAAESKSNGDGSFVPARNDQTDAHGFAPEHTLGEKVEILPNEVPVKKPCKPTEAMKAHLAEVKSRTKEAVTHVNGRPRFEAAAHTLAGTSDLRTQNEDRFNLLEDVAPGVQMCAVYDGHGGDEAAHFLQQRLPGELAKQLLLLGAGSPTEMAAALHKSILFCEGKFCAQNLPEPPGSDEEAEEFPEGGYTSSGACLLVALYAAERRELVVANVGDCRAVLSVPPSDSGTRTAVGLSRDQTAANPMELERIMALGATVDERGYIQGEMTPSRAIGDVQFKGGDPDEKQGIIVPDPEITCVRNVPAGALVVLATDGLWGALTADEAASYFHQIYAQKGDVKEACAALAHEATVVRGSEDDTTVICLNILASLDDEDLDD